MVELYVFLLHQDPGPRGPLLGYRFKPAERLMRDVGSVFPRILSSRICRGKLMGNSTGLDSSLCVSAGAPDACRVSVIRPAAEDSTRLCWAPSGWHLLVMVLSRLCVTDLWGDFGGDE